MLEQQDFLKGGTAEILLKVNFLYDKITTKKIYRITKFSNSTLSKYLKYMKEKGIIYYSDKNIKLTLKGKAIQDHLLQINQLLYEENKIKSEKQVILLKGFKNKKIQLLPKEKMAFIQLDLLSYINKIAKSL